MKDIFSKLKNFLSEPTSTMALIGTVIVLVSSFFVTPDRFCIVMASFLAFFATFAMRFVEVKLTKKLLKRGDEYQALDNDYTKLAKQNENLAERYAKLQKQYDSLLQSMPFEVNHEPKVAPVKEPTGRKAKYSEKDVERIREEIRSTSDESDEFAS